jgi:excisionase family DNA binding protein
MIEAPIASRQVSVAEAAVLLGVSVDTIKRRVRSGALQSTRTAQGRVLVTLPEEAVAPQAPQEPMSAPQDAPQTQGNDADAAALLERVTTVTAERDWLRDRVERAESEREQLRILLSNAQQSLVRVLQAAPQTAPPSSVEAPGAPQPAEPTMGSLQARLRVLAPWVLLVVILLLAFAVGQPAWVR